MSTHKGLISLIYKDLIHIKKKNDDSKKAKNFMECELYLNFKKMGKRYEKAIHRNINTKSK